MTLEAETEQAAAPTLGERIRLPTETLAFFGADELRARVFYEKYALRNERGEIVERTPRDMWLRVAREIASVEPTAEKRAEWATKFYWLLENFRFVPGGRILFGAGQSRRSTLLNCYYIPIKEDSIEAIFEWCKEAARTYSFGGGVGTDISILRPRGAPVNNSAIVSSGSVSFMELMSVTTGTIGQAGRRGALIITIRVDHPDVLDFLRVKRDLAKVNYANISVRLTDAFMEAVDQDRDFDLHFENDKARVRRTLRARELWNELVKSARNTAEPGLIFWDTVKRESPTEYNGMEVQGFNPCSEQCLEDYGCCCLGNVNLAEFVLNAFEGNARIDWESLERAVRYAVRFLDDVLEYNAERHPLGAERKASLWSRRIGVGFTGLADMLIKLRLKYDDERTIRFVDETFERMRDLAYDESCEIAAEKGPAPAFDAEHHLRRPFVQRVAKVVQEKVRRQGIRNCCVLTVPPVGSGSILAGTTSGIEPIFALSYVRRSKSLTEREFRVYHALAKAYMDRHAISREEDLPSFFVTAHQIRPEMRVEMQAAIQKHIDSSISSTVNLPEQASVEDVGRIYFLAWRMGLKGITVYREGSREGILETTRHAEGQSTPAAKFERPAVLSGQTVKFKVPEGSLYVTANFEDGQPREVFVNLGKSGGHEKAGAEALGRLISLYLQHGGEVDEVVHTLKGIQGPNPIWSNGTQLLSVPDAVAKSLEKLTGKAPVQLTLDQRKYEKCSECGERAVIAENGCYRCTACGYTKCG